ncbi:MAG: hypothetical protein JNN18_01135 [Rubrivivax sp.]|jgi:hypothetical protein|nr:hypothetical protein [Rubrivivax sp.]
MSGDAELFQKDVKLELSKFRTKTKPTLAEAVALRLEKKDLDKKADADKLKEIDLRLKALTDECSKSAVASCAVIKANLKKYTFDQKDARGLVKWYADIVDKDSGIDLGGDVKLWGDLSVEKKEASLILKGRF